MMPRVAHRPALDGLRGVAILLVIAFHVPRDGGRVLEGGFVGVDLFFVISGALITLQLIREHREARRIHFRAFYLRRAARILPALVVVLVFTVGFTTVFWSPDGAHKVRRDALCALLFLSTWVAAHHPMWLFSSTWSLSVEEWFYLVWPLGMTALLRAGRGRLRPVGLVLGFVVLGCFARRVELYEVDLVTAERIYFALDTRADGLALGGLVAVASEVGWPRSQALVQVSAAVGALVIAAATLVADPSNRIFVLFGYSISALAAAAVVLGVLRAPPRALAALPLVGVGKISYGLYLWLLPIFILLRQQSWGLRLGALFAVAVASYGCVERPALRARERFLAGLRSR